MGALTLLVLLALAGPALGAEAVSPRVTLEADELTLAHLVPGAPEEWGRVALGRGPRPGGERVLNGAWIAQRAQVLGLGDELVVPEQVVVSRPGSEVGRDEVMAAVQEALAPRLGPGERLRFAAVGLPQAVPAGSRELRVVAGEGPLPASATLWVDVVVDGERRGRAWARVEPYRGQPVVVLARDARQGEVLGPQDVELRSGDAQWDSLADSALAVGRRLTRSLGAGSALGPRDLEVVPLVGRGDTVRLVARLGGVTASTLGKALEAAGAGEAVRVENLSSGRAVVGVVRQAGVVDVTPAQGR